MSMKADIILRKTGRVPEELIKFADATTLAKVLETSGWSSHEEVREILNLIRQDDNLNIKLKALQYMREIVINSLKMSGALVSARKTIRNEDGDEVVFSSDMVSQSLENTHGERKKVEANVTNGNPTPSDTGSDQQGEEPGDRDDPGPPAEETSGLGERPDSGEINGLGDGPEITDKGSPKGKLRSYGEDGVIVGESRPPETGSRKLFPGLSTTTNVLKALNQPNRRRGTSGGKKV